MKNIDTSYTRKQFLLGSSAAAVGLFCGRGLLHAQPGSSPPGPASSATPESADNVPDFPEHHPQFDRATRQALRYRWSCELAGGESNAGRRTESN